MPVDREQWQEKMHALPPWRCPFCSKGTLAPVAEKMLIEETGPSKADHEHDAWEPEWIRARFAGFMDCNNGNCGDMVVVSGNSPELSSRHNRELTLASGITLPGAFFVWRRHMHLYWDAALIGLTS